MGLKVKPIRFKTVCVIFLQEYLQLENTDNQQPFHKCSCHMIEELGGKRKKVIGRPFSDAQRSGTIQRDL